MPRAHHNGAMAVDKRAARLGALALVSVILLGAVGARLWFLQTVQRQSLQAKVNNGQTRTQVLLPERGRIGIFNRSYYEEVLVVRVHPEILGGQRLPRKLVTKRIWRERFEDIASFERYMARNGYVILKFFLYVSKAEQKQRFLDRIEQPEKNWKFSLADAKERTDWKDYMAAYEDAIRHTASREAPWIVVPADRKWFARLVVAAAIVDALESLRLEFPAVDDAKRKELAAARRTLMNER